MKVSNFGRTASVLTVSAAVALGLAACGTDSAAPAPAGTGAESSVTGTLSGAGASSQDAAMQAWIAGFGAANPQASVQYSPDGSGAGREALLAGGVQFAGSDAYLDEEESVAAAEVCGPDGAIHVPVYISPIAVAFNLPGITDLNLDAATIAAIFRGEVTTWNDPAITAQNEAAELPDTAITAVHRGDESGTTKNFTEYLAEAAPEKWTDKASGEWPAGLPNGESASGTGGVISTVASTEGGITYADASAAGSLGEVSVLVGDTYVPFSADAAALAVESSTAVTGEGRPEADMAMDLDRDTAESGAYPVVLVSYHVFCTSYEDQQTVDLVRAFGNYVVSDEGQAAASDAAGSAPLSESLRSRAQAALETIQVRS
ncbi:phosphate ABC transporter substrate-binding protein PstS [Arthrobacter jinronghuae]|uniref:Phosphate-binding protein n=1 Tax=Arthrobacter jinronghuae TaxID=2964609 RepID=A0ABT1NL48_9MICC|nr:phosphate ABC transporter substrate-binding protein PstS [Arthrobacter jinronghuae]MCQ1948409.1 phosphate ABC transporter substrate-binding protein PstS [Arthrobacter jinronghuae]MCQ1951734.1 phosphate ABC transporter substrate-binding protein PstS [Arthrobacter sp. zg-Y238]MCQ1956128.1 phosphate ABC transporter substrate-binding protein PstS [Arthrobacter jinronghuae]UWX80218.1 phosphate ABC transporter substrate-binding protein PstS [Arthrobacter jinronghuae]